MDNNIRVFCDGFLSVYLGANKKHYINGCSICVKKRNKIIYLKRFKIKNTRLPYKLYQYYGGK